MKALTPLVLLIDRDASKSLIVVEMLITIPLFTTLLAYSLSLCTSMDGWVQRSISIVLAIFSIASYSSFLRE